MNRKKQKTKSKTGHYAKSWEYIKESRNYFYAVFGVFVIALAIGFLFPVFFVSYIQEFIKNLALKTQGMNFFELFVFIFKNNITTAFFAILFGLLFFIPLIISFFNGYVLGFVANKVAIDNGYLILLRLLPHGIFEIPALVLSLGLGLKLGFFVFAKNKKKYLIKNLADALRVFVYIILPLLIVAGLIEAGLMILLK